MAIAACTMFLSGLRGGYFEQAFEMVQTQALALNAVVRVALVIGLSVYLIPTHGVIGAAAAVFLSEVVGLVLSVLWARRLMSFPIPSLSWLKIAAATTAMVAAVALVPWRASFAGLVLAMCVGVIVYAAAIASLHVRGLRAFFASPAQIARQRTP